MCFAGTPVTNPAQHAAMGGRDICDVDPAQGVFELASEDPLFAREPGLHALHTVLVMQTSCPVSGGARPCSLGSAASHDNLSITSLCCHAAYVTATCSSEALRAYQRVLQPRASITCLT